MPKRGTLQHPLGGGVEAIPMASSTYVLVGRDRTVARFADFELHRVLLDEIDVSDDLRAQMPEQCLFRGHVLAVIKLRPGTNVHNIRAQLATWPITDWQRYRSVISPKFQENQSATTWCRVALIDQQQPSNKVRFGSAHLGLATGRLANGLPSHASNV